MSFLKRDDDDWGNRNWGERGAVLPEFAIVLVLFFGFLIVGTIEVGNLLIYHQNIYQIAREGARFGGVLPDLDAGGEVNTTATADILTIPNIAHRQIHLRIEKLVRISGLRNQGLEITTDFLPTGFCATTSTTGSEARCDRANGSVFVSVTVNYDALMPLIGSVFDDWPITVTRQSPYLHRG